jgi:hypothetical protein
MDYNYFKKDQQIEIDWEKANELFQYGREIMALDPGQHMACLCYSIALLMKLHISPSKHYKQINLSMAYILEEMIPKMIIERKPLPDGSDI